MYLCIGFSNDGVRPIMPIISSLALGWSHAGGIRSEIRFNYFVEHRTIGWLLIPTLFQEILEVQQSAVVINPLKPNPFNDLRLIPEFEG